MSTPTLAPQRRPAGPPPPQPEPEHRSGSLPRVRPAHHVREGRIWRWAVGGSVLVHLVVLLFSPLFIRVGLPPGADDLSSDADQFRGIRMVEIGANREGSPADRPVETEAAARDVPVFSPSDRASPRTSPAQPRAGDGLRPSERTTDAQGNPLQPGLRDSRLWITPREVPKPERTQEELHAEYMVGLERRLGTWNDSIAAESERARRATDWTVRGKNGERWGVSPDGIHLGGVTVPSEGFTPGGGDRDRRNRAEEQERTRGEIDRQQADTERRRAQQEQIRATRERRDRERASPP